MPLFKAVVHCAQEMVVDAPDSAEAAELARRISKRASAQPYPPLLLSLEPAESPLPNVPPPTAA